MNHPILLDYKYFQQTATAALSQANMGPQAVLGFLSYSNFHS